MKTAPFDLQKALAGHPLVTRSGGSVTNFQARKALNDHERIYPIYSYSCKVEGVEEVYTGNGFYWKSGEGDGKDLFLLLPETIQFPEPPKGEQWHNPVNLTPEQVGVSDGWRLCLVGESCMIKHEGYGESGWFLASRRQTVFGKLTNKFTYRTKAPLPQPKQPRNSNGRFVAKAERTKPIVSQKAEKVHSKREILPLVIADLCKRGEKGIETYGVPLMTHNGRNALVDAYEECLDMACYLRQAIEEQKGN